eukprot:PhM_4_TR11932/c0_g1_i1/m.75898
MSTTTPTPHPPPQQQQRKRATLSSLSSHGHGTVPYFRTDFAGVQAALRAPNNEEVKGLLLGVEKAVRYYPTSPTQQQPEKKVVHTSEHLLVPPRHRQTQSANNNKKKSGGSQSSRSSLSKKSSNNSTDDDVRPISARLYSGEVAQHRPAPPRRRFRLTPRDLEENNFTRRFYSNPIKMREKEIAVLAERERKETISTIRFANKQEETYSTARLYERAEMLHEKHENTLKTFCEELNRVAAAPTKAITHINTKQRRKSSAAATATSSKEKPSHVFSRLYNAGVENHNNAIDNLTAKYVLDPEAQRKKKVSDFKLHQLFLRLQTGEKGRNAEIPAQYTR